MRGRTVEDRRLLELLDPVAEAAGYAIVRLRLMGGAHTGRTLQIMGERAVGTPGAPAPGDMDIDDCGRLSRAVSAVLDAADPIAGEYRLEVSSPGVDRPLTRLADFAAFEGFEAKLELDRLAEGRKRFRGLLAGVEGEAVGIDLEGEDETAMIPFAWITEAKLVLSDALLKRGADLRAARLEAEGSEPEAIDDLCPPPFTGEGAHAQRGGGGSGPRMRGGEPPSPAQPVLGPTEGRSRGPVLLPLRRGRGQLNEEDA